MSKAEQECGTLREHDLSLVEAVAAFLLLSAGAGGGPHGRLRYAAANEGERIETAEDE